MPHRPLKPCAVQQCPGRATNGRYCDDHKHLNKRHHKPDTRPSASKRGYDRKWRRIRVHYLRHHPNCVVCSEPATEVDHIITLAEGGSNKWSNLQSFCKTHHSKKTVAADGGFGNPTKGGGGGIQNFTTLP